VITVSHTDLVLESRGSLKSMDTAKYPQNGPAELVETWHTVRRTYLNSIIRDFFNFLTSFILKIQS
jgi:hypothetical protein